MSAQTHPVAGGELEYAALAPYFAQVHFRRPKPEPERTAEVLDVIQLTALQAVIESRTETIRDDVRRDPHAGLDRGRIVVGRRYACFHDFNYRRSSSGGHPGTTRLLGRLYTEAVGPLAFAYWESPAQDRKNRMKTVCAVASALALLMFLGGCATSHRAPDLGQEDRAADDTNDPFEPFNRAMYTFNDKFDRYLLKPVAKGYRAVVPRPARRGVSNFFGNLREPMYLANNVLQGKFSNAAASLGRFLTNTTFGLFGLFDVATHLGLERRDEDFGQTLAVWGLSDGPYLVLPFFGPSNIRDGIGLYGDLQLYPPTQVHDESTRWILYGTETVDTRARLLEAGDILEQAAGRDPYVFVREAYRQRRRGAVGDGAAPEPAPLDPDIFEEERPPAPSQPEAAPRR